MLEGPTPCGGTARGGPVPWHGVATSVPSSVSALDSIDVSGKIGGWVLVLSNFNNISLSNYLE
jgi:hypothetical protein